MSFVITGTQRTGSSALAEAISLHSQVACGWEWTQHIAYSKKIRCMESALKGDFSCLDDRDAQHMQQQCWQHTKQTGFRRLFRASDKWCCSPRFSPGLALDRLADHLRWFKQHPEVKIIHIQRDNDLAWLASKSLSKASGLYFEKAYPDDLKVTVSVKQALRRLQAKHWLDQRLAEVAHLSVSYETFSQEPEKPVRDVWSLLGLEDEDVDFSSMKLKKQSRVPLEHSVNNFAELKEALIQKGYLHG